MNIHSPWLKAIISSLLLLMFAIILYYSIIVFVGETLIHSLPLFQIGTTYIYYLLPLVGIMIPFLLHINKKNWILTLAIVFVFILGIGFWALSPNLFFIRIFQSNWQYLDRIMTPAWCIILGISVLLQVVYLIRVLKGFIQTINKTAMLIFLATVLIVTLNPFLLTLLLVAFNGHAISGSIYLYTYGTPGSTLFLNWFKFFIQFEVAIWVSFGYGFYFIYQWASKLRSSPLSKKMKDFLILWVIGGVFGIERIVPGKKYHITIFQTITSVVLIFVGYQWNLLLFSNIMGHPFLYNLLTLGIPLIKVGLWIYSLIDQIICHKKIAVAE